MKPSIPTGSPQEIELKLAAPTSDPAGLAKRLAQLPLLARRKATQLQLHNVYFDTPEQVLRQTRVASRLRRVGSETRPQWLQALKIGGASDSALSQRGEWEVPVPEAKLDLQALQATRGSTLIPTAAWLRSRTTLARSGDSASTEYWRSARCPSGHYPGCQVGNRTRPA